jgi:hypothetical protein
MKFTQKNCRAHALNRQVFLSQLDNPMDTKRKIKMTGSHLSILNNLYLTFGYGGKLHAVLKQKKTHTHFTRFSS